jgi:hypothetical protein
MLHGHGKRSPPNAHWRWYGDGKSRGQHRQPDLLVRNQLNSDMTPRHSNGEAWPESKGEIVPAFVPQEQRFVRQVRVLVLKKVADEDCINTYLSRRNPHSHFS